MGDLQSVDHAGDIIKTAVNEGKRRQKTRQKTKEKEKSSQQSNIKNS